MDPERRFVVRFLFFFFNDTATTEIYTLSLHDALPISQQLAHGLDAPRPFRKHDRQRLDRKSTRLNSSHGSISYAVFCLKKKQQQKNLPRWLGQQLVLSCRTSDACL